MGTAATGGSPASLPAPRGMVAAAVAVAVGAAVAAWSLAAMATALMIEIAEDRRARGCSEAWESLL